MPCLSARGLSTSSSRSQTATVLIDLGLNASISSLENSARARRVIPTLPVLVWTKIMSLPSIACESCSARDRRRFGSPKTIAPSTSRRPRRFDSLTARYSCIKAQRIPIAERKRSLVFAHDVTVPRTNRSERLEPPVLVFGLDMPVGTVDLHFPSSTRCPAVPSAALSFGPAYFTTPPFARYQRQLNRECRFHSSSLADARSGCDKVDRPILTSTGRLAGG